MARREISENHAQELEYRLLALLRQTKAYGPTEIKTRYAAITGLASLWNIDLDKFRTLANLGLRGQLLQPSVKNKKQETPETPIEGTEKPLILPMTDDMFEELEGDPNEEG